MRIILLVAAAGLMAPAAQAISVTSTTALTFDKGFAGDGNVTIAATNPSAGDIVVLGTLNRVVNVSFPASATVSNGTDTLTVNNFSRTPNTFRLSATTGVGTLSVGGRRLAVPAAATPGTYTGTVLVTLTEQGTGNSVVASLPIVVPIWRKLTLAKTRDLDFGLGAVGDGTKTVLPSAPTAASIDVSGEPLATFTITVPASITMNCGGCGGTAAQRQLTATLNYSPASPAALDVAGQTTLSIGGVRQAVTVGKRQGTYTATFTVTVAYN